MNGSEPDGVGKTPKQSLSLTLQGNGMESENQPAAHAKVANLVSFFSEGGFASSPLPEDNPDEEDESGWRLVTNKKSQKGIIRNADTAGINTPGSLNSTTEGTTPNRPQNEENRTEAEPHLSTRITASENGKAIDMKKVSPLYIAKGLKGQVSRGGIVSVDPHPDGSLTITAYNQAALLEILAINKIGSWDVENWKPKARNFCQGVISRVHPAITDEEITTDIDSEIKVIKCTRLMKGSMQTSCVLITFDGPTIPESIWLGFYKFSVREFIPDPIQCLNCYRFHHKAGECNGRRRCARCGKNHKTQECTAPREEYKCPNCSGPHSAGWGGCPKRKEARRIIHVKTTQKVTRKEAANIIQRGKTFAEVVSADAIGTKEMEKNDGAMSERRTLIRQEDYNQAVPAQVSMQQIETQKSPKTEKIDEKNRLGCKITDLERKLNAVFNLIIKVIQAICPESARPAINEVIESAKTAIDIIRETSSNDPSSDNDATEEDNHASSLNLTQQNKNPNKEKRRKAKPKKKRRVDGAVKHTRK